MCYAAESTSIEEFSVCLFVVFVSLLCKMTTPDIDHILFWFPFLYQLLVTQSWSSQTSIFDGFIRFVRVSFAKATLSIKKVV